MTPLELINDTVEYYKNNPRGIDPLGHCCYLSPNGAKCAVGRWVDWDKVRIEGKVDYINNDIGSFDNYYSNPIKEYMKQEVKDIPFRLWCGLQNYHDMYIDNKKRTEEEKEEYLQDLINKYKN